MNESLEKINEIVDKYVDQRFEEFKNINYFDAMFSEKGVPTTEKLMKSFDEVVNSKAEKLNSRGKVGDIIRYFHKSIAYAKRGDGMYSPYEYFEYLKTDKEAFKKFYTNRLARSDWFNEKKGANRHFLYEGYVPDFIYLIGLTTAMFATQVSLFKPTLAKNLIKKYANEFSTIFDPFSGYSGRLLGALALRKTYIGQDVNDATVKEANEILSFLEKNVQELNTLKAIKNSSVSVKDSFTEKGTYDCLLTCPPYSNEFGKQIEVWKNSKGETIECKFDINNVIKTCLENYNCKKYIFVVDGSKTDYDEYIAEYIVNKGYMHANNNGINENSEKVIVIEK
jgi:hypothetical protein